MGVLIDGSVLVDYERGRIDLRAQIAGREEEPFFVSVITVSELLHGVHRARDRARRAKRTRFVEAVLERLPLLSIDLATARVHAEVWADLSASGRLMSAHDLWLAAQGIAHGLRIATINVRAFRRVPGLEVEDWSRKT